MNQIPVWREGGEWWIGKPDALPVKPVKGQTKAEALAAVLAGMRVTREDLHFETNEQREELDGEFG
jgi:hypothetical protein